jgi:hypothetical protein
MTGAGDGHEGDASPEMVPALPHDRQRRLVQTTSVVPRAPASTVGTCLIPPGIKKTGPTVADPPTTPQSRSRVALVTGITGILSPPIAGVTTSELGAKTPVVVLVVLLSLVPVIPMLICTYVWSRGALKAIRAAESGDSRKSKAINSALTSALSALPPVLGGIQSREISGVTRSLANGSCGNSEKRSVHRNRR